MGPGHYESMKRLMLAATPLTRDAWHVVVGVALVVIFALWAAAIRRPYPAWAVIVAALALALGLEAVDVVEDTIRNGRPHVLDTLGDIVLTVVAPVLALMAVRSTRGPDGLRGWVLGREPLSGAAGLLAHAWASPPSTRMWRADIAQGRGVRRNVRRLAQRLARLRVRVRGRLGVRLERGSSEDAPRI